MNYTIIGIGTLLLISATIIAHDIDKDRAEYVKHLNIIKKHIEQQQKECTAKRQCDCYKKALESLREDKSDNNVELFSQLSHDEKKQFIHVVTQGIMSECKGKMAEDEWSLADWALLIKIESIQWQERCKRATLDEVVEHLKTVIWLTEGKMNSNS